MLKLHIISIKILEKHCGIRTLTVFLQWEDGSCGRLGSACTVVDFVRFNGIAMPCVKVPFMVSLTDARAHDEGGGRDLPHGRRRRQPEEPEGSRGRNERAEHGVDPVETARIQKN